MDYSHPRDNYVCMSLEAIVQGIIEKGDTLILSQIYVMITEKVNDMAKDKFAQWLNMNKAVQSAADVLTDSETLLPTSPAEGIVMAVHAIDCLVGMPVGIDGSWASVHIATRPDLTLPDLMPGSPYLVAWMERATRGATAVGMSVYSPEGMLTYPKPFLIAHPKLYLYAASAATTEIQTSRARILFTFEKVSAEEFFEALAAFGS